MVEGSSIWLHVGHGKTGSSALHTSFARSLESLARHGVLYPDDPSLARAARGGITSGNASDFFAERGSEIRRRFTRDLREASRKGCHRVVYSSELLYGQVLKEPSLLDVALAEAKRLKVNLQVVLYVRDPLDYAVSFYIQRVKRGGETLKFGQFLGDFNPLAKFQEFAHILEERHVEWHARNYSQESHALLASMEEVLELDPGVLRDADSAPVNRSLSAGELEVQRLLNRYSPIPTSEFASDAWCEFLPHIQSDIPYCDRESIEDFISRCEEVLDSANSLLPDHAHFRLHGSGGVSPGDFPSQSAEAYLFTGEQLDVLFSGLGKRLQ